MITLVIFTSNIWILLIWVLKYFLKLFWGLIVITKTGHSYNKNLKVVETDLKLNDYVG